ncbi:metalloregulator ArsR/SmtB family transcription factor [Herbidospora mongoliensis]|uniref:metalloregulator ArsR/SmtB family transcription factor n=1 Tax=Herbidospora mongoliensis TaxID=688067 RepID=UPI0008369E06|nr:metalloregulator ArsR/SmtB family transcription factor [Herbidospora mongoliensis]
MDQAAEAIADPIRRAILRMVRDERLTVGEIAARFPVSRPAISRHLRVLRESGLVRDDLSGRHRYYSLNPDGLAELHQWLSTLMTPAGWEQRLDALTTEVYRTRKDNRETA